MQRIPRLSAPGRGVHAHQHSAGNQYDRLWRQRQREIAGFCGDAAGNVYGFVYAGGGFSRRRRCCLSKIRTQVPTSPATAK
jgi:hypothetical protein